MHCSVLLTILVFNTDTLVCRLIDLLLHTISTVAYNRQPAHAHMHSRVQYMCLYQSIHVLPHNWIFCLKFDPVILHSAYKCFTTIPHNNGIKYNFTSCHAAGSGRCRRLTFIFKTRQRCISQRISPSNSVTTNIRNARLQLLLDSLLHFIHRFSHIFRSLIICKLSIFQQLHTKTSQSSMLVFNNVVTVTQQVNKKL